MELPEADVVWGMEGEALKWWRARCCSAWDNAGVEKGEASFFQQDSWSRVPQAQVTWVVGGGESGGWGLTAAPKAAYA